MPTWDEIFDFKDSHYPAKMVTPTCCVCLTELAVDLQEQLKAYSIFYDSMSRCERVEFQVRLKPSPQHQSADSSKSFPTATRSPEMCESLATEHGG
jgi:hypothetical protein